MSKEFIKIGGAREHNLKNLTLEIPRDKLVVQRLERWRKSDCHFPLMAEVRLAK